MKGTEALEGLTLPLGITGLMHVTEFKYYVTALKAIPASKGSSIRSAAAGRNTLLLFIIFICTIQIVRNFIFPGFATLSK